MRSLIGAPSAMPNADQMLHKVHFMAILTAFGQSFMQPDIMVFKQNLAALEQLNDKWKLYHKVTTTKPSLKIRTESAISWIYLGIFRDNSQKFFLRIKLLCFFR